MYEYINNGINLKGEIRMNDKENIVFEEVTPMNETLKAKGFVGFGCFPGASPRPKTSFGLGCSAKYAGGVGCSGLVVGGGVGCLSHIASVGVGCASWLTVGGVSCIGLLGAVGGSCFGGLFTLGSGCTLNFSNIGFPYK